MAERSRIEKLSKKPLPSAVCFPAMLLLFGFLAWGLEFAARAIFIH